MKKLHSLYNLQFIAHTVIVSPSEKPMSSMPNSCLEIVFFRVYQHSIFFYLPHSKYNHHLWKGFLQKQYNQGRSTWNKRKEWRIQDSDKLICTLNKSLLLSLNLYLLKKISGLEIKQNWSCLYVSDWKLPMSKFKSPESFNGRKFKTFH